MLPPSWAMPAIKTFAFVQQGHIPLHIPLYLFSSKRARSLPDGWLGPSRRFSTVSVGPWVVQWVPLTSSVKLNNLDSVTGWIPDHDLRVTSSKSGPGKISKGVCPFALICHTNFLRLIALVCAIARLISCDWVHTLIFWTQVQVDNTLYT
jgi:hypothetical protein